MGDAERKAIVGALVIALAPACDIVQGFQAAGDSLFPPQKTYLETPGFRLASGNFRRLNVGVGDELYLFARSEMPGDATLYSMRYVDPSPCGIPGVGRYWTSGLASERPAQVVYLEGDERRGRLYFADALCKQHPLVLEDAELPFQENPEGLLIIAGGSVLMVNPAEGTQREIASGVQAVFQSGPSGSHVLLANGRLGAFTQGNWELIGWAGEGVRQVRSVGSAFLFDSERGVERLRVSNTVTAESVDPEGCNLGAVSSGWVAYHSPCSEGRLAVYHGSTGRMERLDYPANPSVFLMQPDPTSSASSPNPVEDPFFFFSLRDNGALFIRTPDGDDLMIGAAGALDRVTVANDGEHGLAMIDVSGETGRLVRWELDGTTRELATNVLRGSSDLVINWDGVAGDRARLSADEDDVSVLLRRVPRRDFAYEDQSRRWRALFDDFDGSTGNLSIDSSGSATFANRELIARGVRHPRHQFLDVVLPGIAYISGYEAERDIGRLHYRNLELLFTGIVADGVSDFLPSGNGILYAVPYGPSAGVWLARAK